MKTLKIGVILLALLLSAMTMVPMVSAQSVQLPSENVRLIEGNYITDNTALSNAQAALTQFRNNGLLGKEFTGAIVNPQPTTIYDVNGEKLFYSFSIENKKIRIGEVKIAASKVLGASLISIGPGARPINQTELMGKAKEFLTKRGVSANLSSARLVVYNYPMIGLMIDASGSGTGTTYVLDAYDYSEVPVSNQISWYNSLASSALTSGITKWNIDARTLNKTMNGAVSPMTTVSKTLSGFTLCPQQGTNWCPFATAQMISQWYGYYPTQQQIAQTVGVNPDNGATATDMLNGYYLKSVASGGLGKGGSYNLPGSPSNLYTLVKIEIDHNRPLVINIQSSNYHARACAGYSQDTVTLNDYFYIYDPWPVGSGALTWEYWRGNSMNYTSSIFVKN